MRTRLAAAALLTAALAGCAAPTVTTRPAPTVTVTQTATATVTAPPVTIYPTLPDEPTSEPTGEPTTDPTSDVFECDGYIVGGGLYGTEPSCEDEPQYTDPTEAVDLPYTAPEWDYTLPEMPHQPFPTGTLIVEPAPREVAPDAADDLPPTIPTVTADPREVETAPTLP